MAGNGESQAARRQKVTREGQALPLFMSAGRTRVIESVLMSMSTSREMNRYLRWATEAARVGRGEAQAMMLDRAISDYIKRDEAWQAEKATFVGEPSDAPTSEDAVSPVKCTPSAPRMPTAPPSASSDAPPTKSGAENAASKGK